MALGNPLHEENYGQPCLTRLPVMTAGLMLM
jgi:hypothetical protein